MHRQSALRIIDAASIKKVLASIDKAGEAKTQ
jgi:hypothetical protein